MSITGVILAGGAGVRLGHRDKATIVVAGRTMLDHVSARLRPQVQAVLVNGPGRDIDDGRFAGQGPLAGLLAGLQAAPTELAAFVPVDAVRLPVDLVGRLHAGLGTAPGAVVRLADGPIPVCCLLRAALAGKLAKSVETGERTAHRWLQAQGVLEVDFSDASDAIWSINTPAELAAAEQALA